MTVYEGEVSVGRDRVVVRLLKRESRMFLERELIQADGTSFVHAVFIESQSALYGYLTADPYFMALERHYTMIQDKIRAAGVT